jgi:hypothetical protein
MTVLDRRSTHGAAPMANQMDADTINRAVKMAIDTG